MLRTTIFTSNNGFDIGFLTIRVDACRLEGEKARIGLLYVNTWVLWSGWPSGYLFDSGLFRVLFKLPKRSIQYLKMG